MQDSQGQGNPSLKTPPARSAHSIQGPANVLRSLLLPPLLLMLLLVPLLVLPLLLVPLLVPLLLLPLLLVPLLLLLCCCSGQISTGAGGPQQRSDTRPTASTPSPPTHLLLPVGPAAGHPWHVICQEGL